MGEEGADFVLRQVGVEQGSAFSLGKPGLAGLAIEQAALLGTVVSAHSEVAVAAFAVVQTIRILAAEECEVIMTRVGSMLSRGSHGRAAVVENQ